jgi:hypothetical protein
MNERAGLLPAIDRTLHTSRLHLLFLPSSWPYLFGVPAFALAVNVAIAALVDEPMYTGGILSLYGIVFVSFIGQMHQVLSFALGFSVPRRRYHLASAWVAVSQAYLFGIGLAALLAVERSTGGWGVDLVFFGLPFLAAGNPAGQVLVYAGPLVLVSFLGMAWGLVYKRWGVPGLYTSMALSLVAGAVATYLLTRPGAWTATGAWLTAQSPVILLGLWPLVLAAGLGVWDHVIIRRVTP